MINYFKKYYRELLIVSISLTLLCLSVFYSNDQEKIKKQQKELTEKSKTILSLHDTIYVMSLTHMRLEISIHNLLSEHPELEERFNEIYNNETE